MPDTAQLQREVTRVALHALSGTGFALAGSGAIREHGLVNRPTEDIDLFTNDLDTQRFANAVDTLGASLTANGYTVTEERRAQHFARLGIVTQEGEQLHIDLGVDWRRSPAVTLKVGPVLSAEDAVMSKFLTVFGRAEARDFLDVDAFRTSGRFTDVQLLRAAAERDAGFNLPIFIEQLRLAERITIGQVDRYGATPEHLNAVKGRFAEWATELSAVTSPGEPIGHTLDKLEKLSPTPPASTATATPGTQAQRASAAASAAAARPVRYPPTQKPDRGIGR
jgi:Nucleotidyl transferase AbiEii toxin, Type IV TA system